MIFQGDVELVSELRPQVQIPGAGLIERRRPGAGTREVAGSDHVREAEPDVARRASVIFHVRLDEEREVGWGVSWKRSATNNTAGDLTPLKWPLIERRKKP